jgi:hypothetical protein
MPEKIYKSVAEIDADLEKLFAEATKEAEEEVEEPAEAESETSDEPTVQETKDDKPEPKEADTTDDEPEVAETKPATKPIVAEPQKESKQDYAFKQLREEASNAKKQIQEYEDKMKDLNALAQAQGFNTYDDFVKAWKDRQLEDQAKKQNTDPRVLKELNETKSRLTQIEKEKIEADKQVKLNKINTTIDKFAIRYGLNDENVKNIINKMGEDNLTLESLLITPSETLDKMLTGYAQDIIIERKVQEKLAALEKNGTTPAPEKHKNTVSSKKPDPFSKEALNDEMDAFKKENYPWLK